MSEAFRWWLVVFVMGLVTLPLCLGALARLPDRGYALCKPFALLLTGYTFWLLNSIGVLPNARGGIIAALLLLGAISAAFAASRREEMEAWLREHRQYILTVELGFLCVFMVGVWLRSFVGTIDFTEQPMDLMFVNAAAQADRFPPQDPWLAGHTVAYYYFGYLIVAMTGKLAGVPTEIGYNLGFAMMAALALLAAFGIVYNLIRMHESEDEAAPKASDPAPFDWKPYAFALGGALMLVLMGNLVWLFKYASMFGIGGSGFYDWIDVSGLTSDEMRETWRGIPYPKEFFGFFDASRIYPLNDADYRVITEFPAFSFVLGDLHPHVMALPFVLLAVALALSLYRSDEPLDAVFLLRRPLLLLTIALSVGGLAFLNTWDIATMAFVLLAAVLISNFGREGRVSAELLVQTGSFAALAIVPAIIAYLPFYTSFSSQADGVLPVVATDGITHPGTRPLHLLLFWGPLFAVVLPFVAAQLLAARDRITRPAMRAAAAVPGAVIVLWGLLFLWTDLRNNEKIFGTESAPSGAGNIIEQIGDRGVGWISALVIAAALGASLLALWTLLNERTARPGRQAALFALGLASTAFLLILGTEFFYVGDLFNSRMNTVFKLYYQAWLLLALAGGFALYHLWGNWRYSFAGAARYRLGWGALAAFGLACGTLYPVGATLNRTEAFERQGQLRGLHAFSANDRAAFDWLRSVDEGQQVTIVEAVGGDYWVNGQFSRVSMATGVPAVLGWGGHEDQWRGDSSARAGRFEDVNALYQTADKTAAEAIISKYGITYIYVGSVERTAYGEQVVRRFADFGMPVAFTSGDVTVYQAGAQGAQPGAAP